MPDVDSGGRCGMMFAHKKQKTEQGRSAMKFIPSSLSARFNRPDTVSLTRRQLAEAVAPFIDKNDVTNASLAHGFDEAAEWLRIGFDAEAEKGSLYHALHFSLRMIREQIKNADPAAPAIAVKREYLEAIKASAMQFSEASATLHAMSRRKAEYTPQTVQTRDGHSIEVPFTQIYNRPHAAHNMMGMKLEEVENNFRALFETVQVSPAADKKLASYIPKKHY
jgi:hypothetical protein